MVVFTTGEIEHPDARFYNRFFDMFQLMAEAIFPQTEYGTYRVNVLV